MHNDEGLGEAMERSGQRDQIAQLYNEVSQIRARLQTHEQHTQELFKRTEDLMKLLHETIGTLEKMIRG